MEFEQLKKYVNYEKKQKDLKHIFEFRINSFFIGLEDDIPENEAYLKVCDILDDIEIKYNITSNGCCCIISHNGKSVEDNELYEKLNDKRKGLLEDSFQIKDIN